MAQNSNQKIHRFNQEALKQELSAALIIQNQLRALTNDMVDRYPSDSTKELQKNSLVSAELAIKGMLQVDTKEAFVIQQKRMDNLVARLKGKLALEGDLDKALADYRFFHHLHQVILKSTLENTKNMDVYLPKWFMFNPDHADWEQKLNHLRSLVDKKTFEDYKKELIKELLQQESELNLASLSSLALIEQNSRILAETRLSYLKAANDRKKILTELAWMFAGGLLVAAAAVLGVFFPPLVIPGLVIGIAVLGYGVIDFAKENAQLVAKINNIEFGERVPSTQTLEELQAFDQKISGLETSKFLDRQNLHERHWSSEKKWLMSLSYTLSFAGLAFAFAGLAFLFPALGIPLAVIIAVSVLAVVVTTLATVIWGIKVVHEQQALQEMQQEVNKRVAEDDKMINEAILVTDNPYELSSTARVMKIELAVDFL